MKENVEEFMEVISSKIWANDKKMQDYCRKQCSDVFKSESGKLVEFEKPTIKKSFCFGHGYCGITTEEETQGACEQAERARTDVKYFMDENLQHYNELLKMLDAEQNLYLTPSYYNQQVICSIKTDMYFRHYPFEEEKIVAKLTAKDIENLRTVIENEKQKFTKRLQTYLKRYGLSKIHSWTYLVD